MRLANQTVIFFAVLSLLLADSSVFAANIEQAGLTSTATNAANTRSLSGVFSMPHFAATSSMDDLFGSRTSILQKAKGEDVDGVELSDFDEPGSLIAEVANSTLANLGPENDEPEKIAQGWQSPGAGAQPALRGVENGSVRQLTRQILLKEIALEKFNLNYRLNAAKQGRWKGPRYALMIEANNAMGITGGIIGTVERGRHLHSSQRVSRAIQQQANFIPAIGNILATSAAIVEFNINTWHEFLAWHKGFSPGQATRHVLGLKAEIDRLLAERDALVKADSNASRAQAEMLEGKVLRDLRDLSMLEFERFHVGARRTIAFQQAQYLFDMCKYSTNSVGFYLAYLALHRRDRAYNQRAGFLFDVSGALTVAGPILSRAFGAMAAEYTRYGLRHKHINDVETRQVAVLQQDQTALESAMRNQVDNTEVDVDAAAVYGDRTKRFQDQLDATAKERAKGRLTATQNVGSGIYVGGSKIASGVLFTILGHKRYRKGNKDQTASRVTNHLLFASGVIGLQASSFSFADTLRIQVQSEIARHKLAVAHRLPAELMAARLKQLDALEAKLQSN